MRFEVRLNGVLACFSIYKGSNVTRNNNREARAPFEGKELVVVCLKFHRIEALWRAHRFDNKLVEDQRRGLVQSLPPHFTKISVCYKLIQGKLR